MKKTISILALTAFLLTPASSVFATQTATGTTTMTALISPVFALNVAVSKDTNPDPNPNHTPTLVSTGTTIDFGTLTNKDASGNVTTNALRGQSSSHVFLGPVFNGGTQYTITQTTFSPLTGSAGTIPHAVGLVVVNAKVNSTDATNTGTINPAVATLADANVSNRLLYTSTATGTPVTVEVVYGLSGGNADGSAPFSGWVGVPPGQPAGNYTGSILYTLTA